MTAALTALPAIYVLIALGYAFRQTSYVGTAFWPAAEKLCHFVFIPALIVNALALVDFSKLNLGPMASVIVACLLAMAALTLMARPLLPVGGPTFSSIFQGTTRINGIVGIAASAALYGEYGLALAAIVMVFFIPLANLMTVIVMVRFGDSGATGVRGAVVSVFTNPMILAVGAGVALNVTGIGLPYGADVVMGTLGRAALPIGLLAAGAGLEFGAARKAGSYVIGVTVAKLVLMPALAWLLCMELGVTGAARTVTVLFLALPCSVNSYVLARQMGGDAPFMAAAVTVTNLAAAASLPLALLLVGVPPGP
ncbi:MAG: AEC family transporter [Alphaproteobacteria bacterium]